MTSPINPFQINTSPLLINRQSQSASSAAVQSAFSQLINSVSGDSFSNSFNIAPSAGNGISADLGSQIANTFSAIIDFMKMLIPQAGSAANSLETGIANNGGNTAGITNNATTLAGAPQQDANVVVIDNFTPDNTGFNHGQEMVNTILGGGNTPGLAGKINVQAMDTGGSLSNVNQSLQQVLNRVKSGEKVNAVNLSLVDFTPDQFTGPIRQTISELSQAGVPVLVAAGNDGINQANVLAGDGALVVQSTTNGVLNASSGPGNIQSEGRTTSFATANLTPLIAANNQLQKEQAAGGQVLGLQNNPATEAIMNQILNGSTTCNH